MAGAGCAHANATPKAKPGGGYDVWCPACKLSVSARQIDLAWAWMQKAKKESDKSR